MHSFTNTSLNFKGGKLAHFYNVWANLTSDPEILDTVEGLRINGLGALPPLPVRSKGLSIFRKEHLLLLRFKAC